MPLLLSQKPTDYLPRNPQQPCPEQCQIDANTSCNRPFPRQAPPSHNNVTVQHTLLPKTEHILHLHPLRSISDPHPHLKVIIHPKQTYPPPPITPFTNTQNNMTDNTPHISSCNQTRSRSSLHAHSSTVHLVSLLLHREFARFEWELVEQRNSFGGVAATGNLDLGRGLIGTVVGDRFEEWVGMVKSL